MTEAGARIPAWKRLGLALKNQTQSGVTAPEPSATHSDQQQVAPYDGRNGSHNNVQSPVAPTVNGNHSSLGKRKHQYERAEDDAQAPKRGKKTAKGDEAVVTSAIEAPVAADIAIAKGAPTSSESTPTTEPSELKGDPNYRKKKAKPAKSKRRNHEESRAEPAPPARAGANGDRSSPSPDATAIKKGRRTLLASTETDHENLARNSTPQQQRETSRGSTKDSSGSPSAIDRRKSVTFTPDTKRVDGHSAQNLFKKWVAEQKGEDTEVGAGIADPSLVTKISQAVKEQEQLEKSKEKGKDSKASADGTDAKVKVVLSTQTQQEKPAVKAKGKKKDTSIYLSYLNQYHTDRPNWKFNKAKQNDIIDNAVNIFRIPNEHSDALLDYVQGLKGAGAIELLTEKCKKALKELDEEDAKAMDTSEGRQAAQNEALETRLAKERKRRKVEGDTEDLAEHSTEASKVVEANFIRRLRRERAEALLTHLGRAAEILPARPTNGINELLQHAAPVRDPRKRKRRTEVSSDDSSSASSSDSSSDESSSSENSSSGDSARAGNEDSSEADSSSDSESSSEAESGSDSE